MNNNTYFVAYQIDYVIASCGDSHGNIDSYVEDNVLDLDFTIGNSQDVINLKKIILNNLYPKFSSLKKISIDDITILNFIKLKGE